MALFDLKPSKSVKPPKVKVKSKGLGVLPYSEDMDRLIGADYKTAALIRRRRLQILVHSYMYYHLGENLIDDFAFDNLGRELVKLQTDYPEIAKKVRYHEDFIGYGENDCFSGYQFPYKHEIDRKARQLLEINNEYKKI